MADTVLGGVQGLAALSNLDQLRVALERGSPDSRPSARGSAVTLTRPLDSAFVDLRGAREAVGVGEAVLGVAVGAGRKVENILIEMRKVAIDAAKPNLDNATRSDLVTRFDRLREELEIVVSNAEFNRINLVAEGAPDLTIATDTQGGSMFVEAQDLSPRGVGIDALSVGSSTQAASAIVKLDGAVSTVGERVGTLAAAATQIANVSELSDQLVRLLNTNVSTRLDTGFGETDAFAAAAKISDQLKTSHLAIANATR